MKLLADYDSGKKKKKLLDRRQTKGQREKGQHEKGQWYVYSVYVDRKLYVVFEEC